MTIESDGRTMAHVEADPPSAADVTANAEIDEEPPPLPFHRRTPWTYVFPMLVIALIWITIGLVCSPTDFRF